MTVYSQRLYGMPSLYRPHDRRLEQRLLAIAIESGPTPGLAVAMSSRSAMGTPARAAL